MPVMWESVRVAGHDEKLAFLATVLELRGHHVRALALVLPWEPSQALFDLTTRCLRLCGDLTRVNVMSTVACRGIVAALRDDFLAVVPQVAPKLRILDLALDSLDDTCARMVASIVPQLSQLDTLILEGGSAPARISSTFPALPGLKHLHVRHRMPNTALAGFATSAFTLTSLTLVLGAVSLTDLHATLGRFTSSFQRLQLVVALIAPTSKAGPNIFNAYNDSDFLDVIRELRGRRSLPSLSSVKIRIVPLYISTFDELKIRSRVDGQPYDDIEEERKALGQAWGKVKDVEVQVEQDYVFCPCLIRHDACWARWAGGRPEDD